MGLMLPPGLLFWLWASPREITCSIFALLPVSISLFRSSRSICMLDEYGRSTYSNEKLVKMSSCGFKIINFEWPRTSSLLAHETSPGSSSCFGFRLWFR